MSALDKVLNLIAGAAGINGLISQELLDEAAIEYAEMREALENVILDLEMQASLSIMRGEPIYGYHLRDQANKLRAILAKYAEAK